MQPFIAVLMGTFQKIERASYYALKQAKIVKSAYEFLIED